MANMPLTNFLQGPFLPVRVIKPLLKDYTCVEADRIREEVSAVCQVIWRHVLYRLRFPEMGALGIAADTPHHALAWEEYERKARPYAPFGGLRAGAGRGNAQKTGLFVPSGRDSFPEGENFGK